MGLPAGSVFSTGATGLRCAFGSAARPSLRSLHRRPDRDLRPGKALELVEQSGLVALDLDGKVAVGGMREVIQIDGSTTVVAPTPFGPARPNLTQPGGVLTQPTNSPDTWETTSPS